MSLISETRNDSHSDRGLHQQEKKEDTANNFASRLVGKSLAAGFGLSELSKQLRIFHARNEAQSAEIGRLERQLAILADLRGVRVADLRASLEQACRNKAHEELQSRIAKLMAELEAATVTTTLAKGRDDATAPEIANLQLRIGELEEVEEKREREVHNLYEQLRCERGKTKHLESQRDLYERDAKECSDRRKSEVARASKIEAELQDRLRVLQQAYALKMREGVLAMGQKGSASSSASSQMAADYQRLLQSMKEKDEALCRARYDLQVEHEKTSQLMRDRDNRARKTWVDSEVARENALLLIKQLQDADSQNELRLAQYKTRFAVQDERIRDMAQQLESLYAAFGLLKEEHDSENAMRDNLRHCLNEANAEVARHVDTMQEKNLQKEMFAGKEKAMMASPRSQDGQRSGTPVTEPSTPTAGSPLRAYKPSDPTLTTWSLLLPNEPKPRIQTWYSGEPNREGVLITGTLIVNTRSMVRKWKVRTSRLYLYGNNYQWDLGGAKSFTLPFGIAKVECNPNYPCSFIVYTDPFDAGSQIIEAAASSREDYNHWMSALTKATSGGDYVPLQEYPQTVDCREFASPSGSQMRCSVPSGLLPGMNFNSREYTANLVPID